MLTMFFILLLLSSLLFGLILLATGAILLLKVKNKIAGILVSAVGLAFTSCSLAVYMFLAITIRIHG